MMFIKGELKELFKKGDLTLGYPIGMHATICLSSLTSRRSIIFLFPCADIIKNPQKNVSSPKALVISSIFEEDKAPFTCELAVTIITAGALKNSLSFSVGFSLKIE